MEDIKRQDGHLTTAPHHSCKSSKFRFSDTYTQWEEIDTELSAVQLESILSSTTPEERLNIVDPKHYKHTPQDW